MGPPVKPKRPHLRWVGDAAYFDHGGKPRHWEPLGNVVATALAKYEAIMRRRTVSPGTVKHMVQDYLLALEREARPELRLAPGTLVMYRVYERHLHEVFGELHPGEVTQAHVLRYLQNCPRTSFRAEISVLSGAYARWMSDGRLTFNPCFGVTSKRARAKRDRLIVDPEIDLITETGGDRLTVAIDLAFATGLRISDLCGLRWTDFDGGHVKTRKTGVRQSFTVTDTLKAILDRCRALQARVASQYVLCTRRGKPYSRHMLSKLFRVTARKAGIIDVRFHDLRAAAGTEVERVAGEKAAQKFLGHTDARTTRGYLRAKRVNEITPAVRKAKR